MACNNTCLNTPYKKSCQMAYNNAAQTIQAAGTTINILGNQGTDTGVSIDTATSGFTIRNTGLYRISYDVTFTAGAAGTAALTFQRNGVTMPCVNSQVTVAADSVYTLHGETTVYIPVCCSATAAISAQLSGVAAVINNVCASAVKLA